MLVQLSYAIGVAEPLSIHVDTYGTGKKTDEELVEVIRKNWDLRPGVIGMSCKPSNLTSSTDAAHSAGTQSPTASIPQDCVLRSLWQP